MGPWLYSAEDQGKKLLKRWEPITQATGLLLPPYKLNQAITSNTADS